MKTIADLFVRRQKSSKRLFLCVWSRTNNTTPQKGCRPNAVREPRNNWWQRSAGTKH